MSDQYDEYAEQRETLNAHRRHGKGMWGKRKTRKDGKPHTRILSKREEERAADVVRAVVKLCALPLTNAERRKTSAMLGHDFQLHGADKLGPSALWNAVKASPNRHLVINANKKYLKGPLSMRMACTRPWLAPTTCLSTCTSSGSAKSRRYPLRQGSVCCARSCDWQ